MSANVTLDAPKAVSDDVLLAIADGEMPLSELLGVAKEKSVAIAWARGEIEFGRRVRIVTGNPEIRMTRPDESPSGVVVEDGIEWTGPKTAQHGPFSVILKAESELPVASRYRKYESAKNDQGEKFLKPVNIERSEAIAMCALKVRLTDKGMAALSPEVA